MTKALNISLTKAQTEFMQLDCLYPLFVAGLSSGKTHLMGLMAVMYAMHSGQALIGIYEPTHELTRLIAIPMVQRWLNEFKIEFETNKNEHTITTKDPKIGNFLFKSYSEPETIIGYQTYAAFVDELDTIPSDKAQDVWEKIQSRNRQQLDDVPEEHKVWSEVNQRLECKNKQMAFTSPEGFKFCYKRWVQEAKNLPEYQRVHGRTRDNPYVSEAFISERIKTFTPEQAKAYLDGEFVNLTSGTVYYCYNREVHASNATVKPDETVFIGCDFNKYRMAATVYVRRNGGSEWHAVDEFCHGRDTPDLIAWINRKYYNKGHRVIMYPDATGTRTYSNNADASAADIAQLKHAGYQINARPKSPPVTERISATNVAFSNGVLFINYIACPTVADCLEQQAYNKNGTPDKDGEHDDQNDATTYPIVYELPVRRRLYALDFKFVSAA